MSAEKMREEFEVAFVEEEVRLCGEGFRSSAMYMIEQNTFNVRAAWWAWQASRAAIEVELPHKQRPASDDCAHWHNIRNSTIDACGRAIESLGLKIKQ